LPALTVGGTFTGGAAACTVTVTVAVLLNPLLSVPFSWKTYVPGAVNPVTPVDKPEATAIAAVTGPLTSVQTVLLIVAPPFPVAVPLNVTELTGSWIVRSLPALTVGGTFAASTVIVTVEVALNPLSSVAFNWNTYDPTAVIPATPVVRFVTAVKLAVTGPLTCVHTVLVIVAPPFPVAVPLKVTELTGNWIVCPLPALTVGGTFAASTVIVTVDVALSPLLSVAFN
jgi:hypothetical protein